MSSELRWVRKKLGRRLQNLHGVFSDPTSFYKLAVALNGKKPLPFKCCAKNATYFVQLETTNNVLEWLTQQGVDVRLVDGSEVQKSLY